MGVPDDVYARIVREVEAKHAERLREAERARARLPELEAEVRQRADQAAARRAALVRDAAFRARARAGHPFRPIDTDH